jgi:hypothetical protein
VWGAVFGQWYLQPPDARAIPRPHVRELDPAVLRQRAARGATTRLVARAGRDPGSLRVTFEEVRRDSPLAAPPDRVIYGYRIGDFRFREHHGYWKLAQPRPPDTDPIAWNVEAMEDSER